MGKSSVETFYDDFFDTRMSRYRMIGNLRLDLAKKRAASIIQASDVIADFGCGIGIVSEAMAKAARGVSVVGIDLSSTNITYARDTVRDKNITFLHVGIDSGCETLKEQHPQGYDLIVLTDVIEHIEDGKRATLLSELGLIASKRGKLLLTYPSPEYQIHLKANRSEELQIVDNVIEADQLIADAALAGWALKKFSYVDVWMTNQYIHVVFQRSEKRSELERIDKPLLKKLWECAGIVICWPYRAWYYGRRAPKAKE